jgi:hypothetical protein
MGPTLSVARDPAAGLEILFVGIIYAAGGNPAALSRR